MTSAPAPSSRVAILADLLDFERAPGALDISDAACRWRPAHWLLIENGRISAIHPDGPDARPGPDWHCIDASGQWLMPGFTDAHVHSAQIEIIGAFGEQLLQWLERYTFPAEQRMAQADDARACSQDFVDGLLRCGTTSAMVFPTVHATSVDALFEAAQAAGMRLIAGRVMMDRHAPAALCDSVESAERDCRALIERWHGQGRLAYAITPRFAPTSSPAQLALAGRLLAGTPGLYMQTHVAENPAEVDWVRQLFPDARSYLDVYERHGLLGERSMMAHGIWLDDIDVALLAQRGAAVAHCPSSNLFLGSGLFDWPRARDAGHGLCLASDVGAGTTLFMPQVMMDACKVQALRGQRVTAWELLHGATLGAAQALRLQGEIGQLEPGCAADVVLWHPALDDLQRRRQRVARSLHERVLAWLSLATPQHVAQVWVAGQRRV
ncbi:guanine deaminase [Amphibiibacter pelophylacis]|uniref:Guanine deaminase n=1 Tax=Amphibiibacter pelophylacis TaxID=1799477 RepID=A0ACC6P0I0_9BURK